MLAFPCFILYSKARFACYSRYLLTSSFFIPVPCHEKDIFFLVLVPEGVAGVIELVNVALVVGALTWITVMLNGLPLE